MADDKKFKKKDKKKDNGGSEALHWVEIVFGILILLYFLNAVINFIGNHSGQVPAVDVNGVAVPKVGFFTALGNSFSHFFLTVFPTIQFFSIFLTVIFIMAIIYTKFRLHYLEKFQELKEKQTRIKMTAIEEGPKGNPKWQRVLEHVNSPNPSDWRLAILESDILLGDMLEKMGYHGEGIGERLKSVEKSDFNTIDNAWEAHKIRNAIAHEGADFLLSQKEAKRVVALYQTVFEEFMLV